MNWLEPLFTGPSAEKKKRKIIRRIEKGQVVLGVYVITLAANRKDLLDVLPAFLLLKPQNAKRRILGLAVTKEEALEVCKEMILRVYEETGGYDVRSFFS